MMFAIFTVMQSKQGKTIIIGSRLQLSKLTISDLTVGGCSISPSLQVCNLGCWFDSNLTMNKQITKTCSTAFYHIHGY